MKHLLSRITFLQKTDSSKLPYQLRVGKGPRSLCQTLGTAEQQPPHPQWLSSSSNRLIQHGISAFTSTDITAILFFFPYYSSPLESVLNHKPGLVQPPLYLEECLGQGRYSTNLPNECTLLSLAPLYNISILNIKT